MHGGLQNQAGVLRSPAGLELRVRVEQTLKGPLEAARAEPIGQLYVPIRPISYSKAARDFNSILAVAHALVGLARLSESPSDPAAAAAGGGELVRLFVSVGSRDDIGPGDLLGSLAGESGVDGSQFGRIEIRDTFSLVEVEKAVAEKVIKAVNGVTIRGRSTRVDYDRGGRAARQTGPPRGRKSPRGD